MQTNKTALNIILLQKSSPFALFCVCAAVIALFGSSILLALIYLVDSLFNFGWVPSDEAETVITFADLFGYIIIAPMLETFILGFFIRLLLRIKLTHLWVCIVSAIGWSALHALIDPVNFFGTVWSFFIFSHCYLTWLDCSKRQAYYAALVPHMLLNTAVMLTFYTL